VTKLRTRYARLDVEFKIGVRGIPRPDNDTGAWHFMPLELPIELFQLVVPYRSYLFDSVAHFLSLHTTQFDREYESVLGREIRPKPQPDKASDSRGSRVAPSDGGVGPAEEEGTAAAKTHVQTSPSQAPPVPSWGARGAATIRTTGASMEEFVGDGVRLGLLKSRYSTTYLGQDR